MPRLAILEHSDGRASSRWQLDNRLCYFSHLLGKKHTGRDLCEKLIARLDCICDHCELPRNDLRCLRQTEWYPGGQDGLGRLCYETISRRLDACCQVTGTGRCRLRVVRLFTDSAVPLRFVRSLAG